jgi:hypothetical protein
VARQAVAQTHLSKYFRPAVALNAGVAALVGSTERIKLIANNLPLTPNPTHENDYPPALLGVLAQHNPRPTGPCYLT